MNVSRASRYQIVNAAWFAFLVGFLTVWFRRHLEDWVTQATLIGGTMGAWAVLNIAQGAFGIGWGGEKGPILQRMLSSSSVREYLLVVSLLTIVLYATTFSVHLVRGEEAIESSPVVAIEASGGGINFGDRASFGAGRLTYSRPFLLRFRATTFKLFLVGAFDRDTVSRTLCPPARLELAVPDSFPRAHFHVLRIVPGPALYTDLSDDPRSGLAPFRLIMRGRDWADTVKVLSRESIYIGADSTVLSHLREAAGEEALRQAITQEWDRVQLTGEGVSASATFMNFRLITTPRLAAGETVVLDLQRKNTRWSQSIDAPAHDGIRTVFIAGKP